jgi:UDP-N-acetylmuramoyl-L-alanyl-D-glutamate--2,6-diaminopimelate ligase
MTATRRTLAELIHGLPVDIAQGSPAMAITAITEDSRQVLPGCLFIARSGEKVDGRAFVNDALKAGAVAVLAETAVTAPAGVAILATGQLPTATALIAERFFGAPSSRLNLVGVTGTNGKTTSTWLIQQLLNRAGIKCGLIGTVQVDDGGRQEMANLTTPPAVELSRWIHQMVTKPRIAPTPNIWSELPRGRVHKPYRRSPRLSPDDG